MSSGSSPGHRQRLREHFFNSGLQGFHDYEVIELLLSFGTPHKDCKQPAKNAVALILVHNHPSGNTNPSNEDIAITNKLIKAIYTIDVNIHDQLIIAGNDYHSFAENILI